MNVSGDAPSIMYQADLMRRFTAFLDADDGRGPLAERIRSMVSDVDPETIAQNQTPRRLIVSVDDLRMFDPALAQDLLATPVDHLPVFERAMQDLIAGEREDLAKNRRMLTEFRIGLDGSLGSRHITPRGLTAQLVGGIVSLEGIVTRASNVRPRLVVSVHYCPTTGQFYDRTYRDSTSVSSLAVFTQNAGMPGSTYPTRDDDGNPLETEFGKCWYRDFQRVTLQEMPECSPAGQLPRSVDVFFEGDLCDSCKPGDRVRIVGIYRALGGAQSSGSSGIFKTVVVANHVVSLTRAESRVGASTMMPMHDQDIKNIRQLAGKGNVFDTLARSVAPSICGHEYIKKALLLLLIGGKERNLENGTHLRGDINIMMVGDPSTAKSQLLRFILHTAPLALSTTGRGSSGVGLTAAVTSDPDTNERHLEAGAMVLADRGVVCIDEFDKMSDEDRVAIHEVMEQQTVTIAKAGIHASLNARCSVVAAANPIYGSYDKSRKPHENIALPDSLLSRFDLLFIVLDSSDSDRDRQIADHVLRGHRFRKATHTLDEIDGELTVGVSAGGSVVGSGGVGGVSGAARADSVPVPVAMYENASTSLYSVQAGTNSRSGRRRSARQAAMKTRTDKILSTEFLKRYINYAKTRTSPTLTVEAAEYIAEAYRDLRQDMESTKTLPVTARCLETLIRLATAHAKCRLDKVSVTEEDAVVAVELLRFALFNQAEPEKSEKAFNRQTRGTKRKHASLSSASDTDTDDSDDDDHDNGHDSDSTDEQTQGSRTKGSSRSPKKISLQKTADKSENVRRSSRVAGSNNSQSFVPDSEEAEGGTGQIDVIPDSDPVDGQPNGAQYSQITNENRDTQNAETVASSSDEVLKRVMAGINAVRGRSGMLTFDALISWLAEDEDVDEDAEPLTASQVRAALKLMADRDQVLISDDNIFVV